MQSKKCDIAIIGGGPSGLTAAIITKRLASSLSVLVIEKKDSCCLKLALTGNGKCNISNEACSNPESGITNVEFDDVIQYLNKIGADIFADADGRFYPREERGSKVKEYLEKASMEENVEIRTNSSVSMIEKSDGEFRITLESGEKIASRAVVVATGGKSYPKTGSTGDGYVLLRKLGHTINTLIPSLTAIDVEEDLIALKGRRVKGKVELFKNGGKIFEEDGEIQFNSDCISGICAMNASRLISGEKENAFILDISGVFSNGKDAGNFSGTYHVIGLEGWKRAQVTKGGVSLDEIDLKTMESKLIPGIYVIGETLDYDGPCGGFNLHNAWSTGIAAGRALAAKLR